MIDINARLRTVATAALCAVAVAGCGGGGGGSHAGGVLPNLTNTTPVVPPATNAAALGNVSFQFPAAPGGKVTTTIGRQPLYLVAGANVIACVSVKNLDPATQTQFNTPYAGSQFTVCQNYPTTGVNVTVPAPPGNDTFTVAEYNYSGLPASGFTSTSTQALPPGLNTATGTISTVSVPSFTSGTITAVNGLPGAPVAASQTPTLTATGSSQIASVVSGTRLLVDTGAAAEFVDINAAPTGATATTEVISAVFKNAHAAGATVQAVVNVPPGAPSTTTLNALLTPGTPTAPITLNAQAASFAFGPLPVSGPARETAAFLKSAGYEGVPIPIEGLDGAGNVIYGKPILGAGPLNGKLTLTLTEQPTGATPAHARLLLIDANNGNIEQSGNSVVLTQLNALGSNDVPAANAADATAADPYVVLMQYDGTSTAVTTSETVTVTTTATIPQTVGTAVPIPVPTPLVIRPQSGVYTAVSSYADAGPTFGGSVSGVAYVPNAIIPNGALFLTDGTSVRLDGNNASQTIGGTNLTAVTTATFAAGNTQVFAVDNTCTTKLTGAPGNSCLYAFNQTLTTTIAVQTQNGQAGYFAFKNPQGVVYSTTTKKFYVADNNQLYVVDLVGNGTAPAPAAGPYSASNVFAVAGIGTINGTSTAGSANGGTGTSTFNFSGTPSAYVGMAVDANNLIYIADPGNGQIRTFNPTTNVVGNFLTTATSIKFAGLAFDATGKNLYATAADGNIYYVTAAGPIALGPKAGAATDGLLGTTISLTPSAAPAIAATPYIGQFAANSFFNVATPPTTITAPYNSLPFAGGKIFGAGTQATLQAAAPAIPTAGAGIGLVANSTFSATAAGGINATGGLALIPSNQPVAAAGNVVLTPNSFMFADGGKLRTLVQ